MKTFPQKILATVTSLFVLGFSLFSSSGFYTAHASDMEKMGNQGFQCETSEGQQSQDCENHEEGCCANHTICTYHFTANLSFESISNYGKDKILFPIYSDSFKKFSFSPEPPPPKQ